MKEQKGKVSFIRKNGKVIPIKKNNNPSKYKRQKKSALSNVNKTIERQKRYSKQSKGASQVGAGLFTMGVGASLFKNTKALGIKSMVLGAVLGVAGLAGKAMHKSIIKGQKLDKKELKRRGRPDYEQNRAIASSTSVE